jgi:carbamoyl-phosphate synthase small subunit
MEQASGVVRVTSQNHGFALGEEGLARAGAIVSYVNLNDNTVEGLRHEELPLLSIQFHPEASPGPNDSASIVKHFVDLMKSA